MNIRPPQTKNRFRICRIHPALFASVLALCVQEKAFATADSWLGTDSSTWEDTANWSAGIPTTNAFQVTFGAGGSATVDQTAAETVNTLTFNATAQSYTFTGGTGNANGLTLDANNASNFVVIANNSASAQSFANTVTISDSLTQNSGTAANISTGNSTGTLNFTNLVINATTAFSGANAINVSGTITGTAGIQIGANNSSGNGLNGTLNLSGNGNSFSNPVVEPSGANLGNTVTLASTFNGTTTNTVVAAFSFDTSANANTVTNFSASANNTLILSGSVGNGGMSGGTAAETLNINGPGIVRFAGGSNYIVPTKILSGATLQIGTAASASQLRSGAVTINNGGTLLFAGGGTLGATNNAPTITTVQSGGILSFADGVGKTTTISNSLGNAGTGAATTILTVNSGGALTFDLGTTNATNVSDILNSNGTLNMVSLNGNVIINLNGIGATLNTAQTYTLISTAAAGDLIGTAPTFSAGSFTGSAANYTATFADNGQNLTVTFAPVPEPGTWIMSMGLVIAAAIRYRRRIRASIGALAS